MPMGRARHTSPSTTPPTVSHLFRRDMIGFSPIFGKRLDGAGSISPIIPPKTISSLWQINKQLSRSRANQRTHLKERLISFAFCQGIRSDICTYLVVVINRTLRVHQQINKGDKSYAANFTMAS